MKHSLRREASRAVKYPALVTKSKSLKKVIQALIYPINLLIGWMGSSFLFLPHLSISGKRQRRNIELTQPQYKDYQRKSDLKVLNKVLSFLLELAETPKLKATLNKVAVGQRVFLSKGNPSIVAK